jgi:hypothetical protein
MIVIRMLCWLVAAFAGAVLLGAVSDFTKSKITDRDFGSGVIFRIALMLYGYYTLTAFSWVFP